MRAKIGQPLAADEGRSRSGLVTAAPDDIDWADEVRIAVEERVAMSPDALTGMEANLRFNGTETMATRDLRAPHRVAELDLPAPQRRRREGAPQDHGKGEGGLRLESGMTHPERLRRSPHRAPPAPGADSAEPREQVALQRFNGADMSIDYSEKIPNNVNLSEDRTLQRALEQWQPNYLHWWDDMGPDGSKDFDVYLRTAVSVDPQGWAQFGYVKMPEYRWGISPTRAIRTARSTSATTSASRPGRTCPASTAPTCAASS